MRTQGGRRFLWGSLASCGRLSIGPPAAQSASLRESHARFKLTPEHRAAWLLRMKDACSDTGSEDLALFDFFRQASKYLALAEHPDLHQLARSRRCASPRECRGQRECRRRVNATDTQGVTPLRRALNCRKAAVADLLNAWKGT